jgi:hypothetical protein
MWWIAAAWADGRCSAWSPPSLRGVLMDREEVSGLAVARVDAGALLYHEDDDGEPRLYRYGSASDAPVDVRVAGLDWEDVAIGGCPLTIDACSCVALGDIGDNGAIRTSLQIAWFAEPPGGAEVIPEVWTVWWPDGPRDAEALLLDPSGEVVLVAKDGGSIGFASAGGALAVGPGPDVGGDERVIAGSVSPDGRRVALRTEAHLWLYHGDDVRSALSSQPVSLPVPDAARQEAIAFAADGHSIWMTGEGTNPDIYQVTCLQFSDEGDTDAVTECLAAVDTGCGGRSALGLVAPMLVWARRRRG